MTILHVEILLHYHYSSEDFPNSDAPAVVEACEDLCKAGILWKIDPRHDYPHKYGCNQDAIDAYVNAVLAIPLPKQIWVIPQTPQP